MPAAEHYSIHVSSFNLQNEEKKKPNYIGKTLREWKKSCEQTIEQHGE